MHDSYYQIVPVQQPVISVYIISNKRVSRYRAYIIVYYSILTSISILVKVHILYTAVQLPCHQTNILRDNNSIYKNINEVNSYT